MASNPTLIRSADEWLSHPDFADEWLNNPARIARRMQVQAVAAALVLARRRVRGCVGPCGDAEALLASIVAEEVVPQAQEQSP